MTLNTSINTEKLFILLGRSVFTQRVMRDIAVDDNQFKIMQQLHEDMIINAHKAASILSTVERGEKVSSSKNEIAIKAFGEFTKCRHRLEGYIESYVSKHPEVKELVQKENLC